MKTKILLLGGVALIALLFVGQQLSSQNKKETIYTPPKPDSSINKPRPSQNEVQDGSADNTSSEPDSQQAEAPIRRLQKLAKKAITKSSPGDTGGSSAPTPADEEPVVISPVGRFRETVFDDVISHKDITYKSTYRTKFNIDGDGVYSLEDDLDNPVDLKVNVYEPAGDAMQKRPLIIFVYGGGWIIGDRNQREDDAMDFVKRGYVAMTIDYTMMPPGNVLNPVPDSENLVYPRLIAKSSRNVYEAYAFALANKSTYKIDQTRIGIAGWSAGGMISQAMLHTSYSPEPIGVRAVLGASNILPAGLMGLPPFTGFRSFSTGFNPKSVFASYDDDLGFAGGPNDHAADCAYLDSIGNDCQTVTYAGSGHELWFHLDPLKDDTIEFFASNVAVY